MPEQVPDEVEVGISRRDVLKRGTMAGLGLVWVAPKVSSFSMTAQFAQATSPVPETTAPEDETTVPDDGTTGPTTDDTTIESSTPSTEGEKTSPTDPTDPTEPEVAGTVIENTTQPEVAGGQVEAGSEVKDEVLASQLPFTGLPLEQLIPIAGGAVATGAAVLRMAREKKEPEAETAE